MEIYTQNVFIVSEQSVYRLSLRDWLANMAIYRKNFFAQKFFPYSMYNVCLSNVVIPLHKSIRAVAVSPYRLTKQLNSSQYGSRSYYRRQMAIYRKTTFI